MNRYLFYRELVALGHETFALATQYLLHDTDEGPGDDILELLDKLFLKSAFERMVDDVLRLEEVGSDSASSNNERAASGLLVRRQMLDFNPSRNSGPERRYVDWVKIVPREGEEEYVVDNKAQDDLAKIETRLVGLWGEDRVIDTEVWPLSRTCTTLSFNISDRCAGNLLDFSPEYTLANKRTYKHSKMPSQVI